jgi:glycosyltransferase involved in cell wall biosynthesis
MKLSAVVITKNEEKNIEKCLKSLSFCDEIVVVDDYSSDKTKYLAQKLGAHVFSRRLNGDFATQRNFGLSKAKGDWVLFVDADEVVTNKLAQEIGESIKKVGTFGFMLKRKGIVEEWVLRLGRLGKGKWERKVHEIWKIDGIVGKLSSSLLHSPPQSLLSYIVKLNKYSTLHAKSNIDEGKKSGLVKILFWPFFKFFQSYFVKKGYRSGLRGFVFCVLLGFHSYLAWSKLWVLQKKN